MESKHKYVPKTNSNEATKKQGKTQPNKTNKGKEEPTIPLPKGIPFVDSHVRLFKLPS